MFRKLTDRITTAANNVLNSVTDRQNDPRVSSLVAMGFDREAAAVALQAANGDVDRAAELLLMQHHDASAPTRPAASREPSSSSSAAVAARAQATTTQDDEAILQQVIQESLEQEERRHRTASAASNANPSRTAAVHKAGQAAVERATGVAPTLITKSANLSKHHPDVKVIPKLQDKTKEEQILRTADRLKASPQAVDTLLRAFLAVRDNPEEQKFLKIDKTTLGYQRSLANAPGAQDLLFAMNFRNHGSNALVLDPAMVDPALLYLAISALEQTRLTDEYKRGKQKATFAKAVKEIQQCADSSEAEALKQAEHMSKCPSEPANGRGALMQVVLADDKVSRRFDGDDTLSDVLHWLGCHGSAIPEKILSREWSLVDLNHFPIMPMDCAAHQHHTLQYIGCWPSGLMEVVPSTDEWKELGTATKGSTFTSSTLDRPSRGLGAAPSGGL